MTKGKNRCAICGLELDPSTAIGHVLMAHGPLVNKRRRTRIRKKLPKLHRRLEEKGFSEEQAHLIIQVVGEEFRTSGLI